MGRWRDRLRGAVLRPLRRWIRDADKCAMEFSWSFSGLDLRLGTFELALDAVNAEAMQSSPLVLRRASVDSATLAFSIVRSPAIVIVIQGLNAEFSARDPTDPYWKNSAADPGAREKLEKLASIDPEGAYEHSRAKKKEETSQSSGFFLAMLISFLLSAVRIELRDAEVSLRSRQGGEASISATRIVVGEDMPDRFFKGSLFGSLGNSVIYRSRMSTKACSATRLGLTFSVNNSQDQAGGDDSKSVLMIMVWFSFFVREDSFSGLKLSIPEAVGGLNSPELDLVLALLDELEGPRLTTFDSIDSRSGSVSRPRDATELWRWAVTKVLSASPRRRLRSTVRAGMLRRRYCSIYGDWLQKVDQPRNLGRTGSISKLSSSIDELEKDLSLEAIALARRIARRHIKKSIAAADSTRRGDDSRSLARRKWNRFLKAIGYTWEDDHTVDQIKRKYILDCTRGSLVFDAGGGDTGVCLRWRKMSMAYRSEGDAVEQTLVLGSLRGELVRLGTEGLEEASTESRLRWSDDPGSRFRLFSTSSIKLWQPARVLQGYSAGFQENHTRQREKHIRKWKSKPWKHHGDDRKLQGSLDALQMPFLMLSYGTSPGDDPEEDRQGSIVFLALGEVDMSVEDSTFSKMLPIISELERFKSDDHQQPPSKNSRSSDRSFYRDQIELCRSLVCSIVPDTRLQFVAVAEKIRLTLQVPKIDRKLDPTSLETSLEFDLGYVELALWPGNKHRIVLPRREIGRSSSEGEILANNFVLYIEGSRIGTTSGDLLKPLTTTLESSFQRENYANLFDYRKYVQLAASLKIPALDIHFDIGNARTAIQVVLHHLNAASAAASSIYDNPSANANQGTDDAESASDGFSFDLTLELESGKVYFGGGIETETSFGTGIFAISRLCLIAAAANDASSGICLKFQSMQISLVPTNMNFDQVLRERSPLKTFSAESFTLAFDASEARVDDIIPDRSFHCSTVVDLGLVSASASGLEKILASAKQHSSTNPNLHLELMYTEALSIEVEAGLAVFETTVAVDIVNFVSRYVEYLEREYEQVMASLNDASANAEIQNTDMVRSYSFPEGNLVAIAPFRSHSTPSEILQANDGFGLTRSMSVNVRGLSIVLFTADKRETEGILFVFSGRTELTSGRGSYKINADVSKFSAISLRSIPQRVGERSQSRIPQFGFSDAAESSGDREDSRIDNGSKTSNPGDASDMNCMLDNLTISSSLIRQSRKSVDPKWEDSWHGQVAVAGLNIAVTTYELQMLVRIISPLSLISLPRHNTVNNKKPGAQAVEKILRNGNIPDGAIVALKDAQEHLYLSVEDSSSQSLFHLGGAWHYTVAGQRALFKVKYHDKNKDIQWFTLVSLYAKTSAGVPLRVHYQPGSRQLEISSTSDGPLELWQCVPYRSSDDEINIYNGIFGNLVHLINQKSKQGLALVDGIPVVSNHPGNAFKIDIVAEPGAASENNSLQETATAKAAIANATGIPEIRFDIGSFYVTLLHEAAGAVHLLPLVRIRLEELQGLAQASLQKARIIGGCSFVIEHYEAQTSSWLPIVNPVMMEIIGSYRLITKEKKFPISFFSRLKKVEVVLSELSLDSCLFLIGVMDLAGPFTIKHSPVLVNRCQIENQTGLNVLFRFDRGNGGREEGKVNSWQTSSYLMRHVRSRRGSTPAEVSHSVAISLEKPGIGSSTSMAISLAEPGVFAGRTRLEAVQGSRINAPGPIVVIDVSKQSQDGIFLTVSPMIKIHNATGLTIQLRCRRPKQGEGGAIVTLKDGDIIDDSMGAFDALNLEGEIKKALLSFNVGNFLLSIRPEINSDEIAYDWSEDVKGAKAVRVSGLFDKLHYNFKKTLKSKSLESSFGSVFCKSTTNSGINFLIRTLRRQVPVTRLNSDQQQKRSLVAWQEQQELLLLPTLKVFNFLSAGIHVRISSSQDALDDNADEVAVAERGGRALLYADLNALFLVFKVDNHGFVSNPVDISTGHKRFQELAKKSGSVKDVDIEIVFKDGSNLATLKVYRSEDGVLELVVYTKYMLQNDSQIPMLCCVAKAPSRWQGRRVQNLQWPPSAPTYALVPSSSVSWFPKSSTILLKRQEEGSQPSWIDLNSLSGSSELSLGVRTEYLLDKIQLGIRVEVPSQTESDPSHIVRLAARYTVANESPQPILVCQDGLEDEENHYVSVEPSRSAAVHAQEMDIPDKSDKQLDNSTLSLRFRLKELGWRWSGRIGAASLGSFFLKLRRSSPGIEPDRRWTFAVVHIDEENSSLVIHFRLHSREAVPYRIENRLRTSSITFYQKDISELDTLLAMASTDYVWDDLSLPHRLFVSITGTQASSEINLDKVKAWKSFAASHRSKGFSLQLPFQANGGGNERDQSDDLLEMGYEVYADGPTRVLRVCQKVDSTKKRYWESEMSIPRCKVELKIPTFKIFMVETSKQRIEDLTAEELSGNSPFTPFLCAILASTSFETFVTSDHAISQLRIQSLGADMKWQGAPFAAMLRVHDQDRLNSSTTALHAAVVLSNLVANPIQAKYASILIQAFDLNVDEDTLMKFVPFYRTSLSTASSSLQIYFERFEIHPIKIVASFVPGNPRADYTSAQETFRALLHTVIKLPSVRGATVELNGVLLSHALLTFKQLVMKCFQHYSWYAMRAIYIARGSKLLPPGFSSLFDDSAASSLDVFFDPASGSIDLQGLTLGMFNLLSRGLRKRGQGGTSRYLGDLENTVKKAGSNIVFAVVTEISDNVLKGAETNGFDGMINGFRRGILNVAMEPLVLQKAVVKGGSTRRIQLDRSVGTDEAYIEGYIQAMLDALFKQEYLKVKVMEDQVILKNLPPNSMLLNEIVSCVKNFLISEGLLAGEASIAAVRSMRLLRGESERRVVPAIISLSEQLLVIFAIRGLRQYTRKLLHLQGKSEKPSPEQSKAVVTQEPVPQLPRPNFKRTISNFFISSAIAYIDGRLCRHIPNELARRIVSGFLLSFVE